MNFSGKHLSIANLCFIRTIVFFHKTDSNLCFTWKKKKGVDLLKIRANFLLKTVLIFASD